MLGPGQADASGAKAFCLQQSILLPRREPGLPGGNRPWGAVYTDAVAERSRAGDGGGRTSCSFVRATSSAANRKAGEEVGSADRVWPLPAPGSKSEEHDCPPHFPICCGCGLCRVGSRPDAKRAPRPRRWGRGGSPQPHSGPDEAGKWGLRTHRVSCWEPRAGRAVSVWSLDAEPRVFVRRRANVPGPFAPSCPHGRSRRASPAGREHCANTVQPLPATGRGEAHLPDEGTEAQRREGTC